MIDLIEPDWIAPAQVGACTTQRGGGVSRGPFASLNLGDHVGDDPVAVLENRARLVAELALPAEPRWLQQLHGTGVHLPVSQGKCGDACFADSPGRVCTVVTADCLPVLFCNSDGTAVAVAHAGWRGLLAGVLEQTVSSFPDAPERLMAWMGPAIGPQAFEVGDEVRAEFVARDVQCARCFEAHRQGHWLADLYGLARLRLAGCGVRRVTGGDHCTFDEPEKFFSYRRDGISGRMATLIWLRG